ncbi:hypothetical protein OE749_12975 [Aestuariibacter sp. AA17]|uniref:Uncharacterized protein n=1 Tax=Fluctibacter corallii TaxID=2984329 RepID=A0ABT3AAA4_9ALTE|nr:hypothetical protein [Aestuariibacter sp. AA17]MCV2885606.1 hypothetical protein [Aestuariibacter sp. AA17]
MIQIDYLISVTSLPYDLQKAAEDPDSDLYSTYMIYQRLVNSSLLWRVWYIDEHGQHWLEVNFVNDDGEAEFHTIVVDEGTYERVEHENYHVLTQLIQ